MGFALILLFAAHAALAGGFPRSAQAAAMSPAGVRIHARESAQMKRLMAISAAAIVTAGPTLAPAARARIDAALVELDRAWIDPAGLDGRPWFRSMLAASDRDSGYAAVMLPLLSEAVGSGDADRVRSAAERYQRVFDRLDAAIRRAAADVPGGTVPSA